MALQNVKGTLPHGLTLAFLREELLDEGPAAQTVDGLEFFQGLPAFAAQFSGSGTGGCTRQCFASTDRLSSSHLSLRVASKNLRSAQAGNSLAAPGRTATVVCSADLR